MKATQEQIITKIAEKEGISKREAKERLDSICGIVKDLILEGYDVALPGLGTLKHKERSARNGRNPQTGEPMLIPAKKTVAFKPHPDLESTETNSVAS